MAHQQSSGSQGQGFGRQPRQGLRLGAGPQLGRRHPGGMPPPVRNDGPRVLPTSRGPGSGKPLDMERSLDHNVNMRTTSHASGYTLNRMPSSVGLVSSHRGGRLQDQRSRPLTFGQGYDDTASDIDAKNKKRSGENLQEVASTGRWMKAFKKRQKTATSEESAVLTNSTNAPAQDSRQGDVIVSERVVLIPAFSSGPSDELATAPTLMPETENVVESPVPCLELQGQTSIEPASITAIPQADTSRVNASDVDTPDQAAEVDVMLETPSTPEHRCSLPWDCELNE